MLTRVNTVKAIDTTGAVNSWNKTFQLLIAIGNENCRTFASSLTKATRFALVGLDVNANNTLSRKNSEQSAYRTKTIAIETSVDPCHNENDNERHCSNYEDGHRAHPNTDLIIVVVARCFTPIGQDVIAHLIQWLQQHRDNATKRAVRCKQLNKSTEACKEANNKQCENSVPKNAESFAVFVGETPKATFVLVKFEFARNPRDNILHNAQWANHRTIDTTHEHGDGQKDYHHNPIKSEQSRQKLQLGHPSHTMLGRTSKVKEQPIEAQKED